jgi:hypothetical protein
LLQLLAHRPELHPPAAEESFDEQEFPVGVYWRERLALVLPDREDHQAGACRIAHGPNDSYFENIVAQSVASVRRSLATVFSIPDDAEAWASGSVVGGQYRLRAGDSLDFVVRRGRKGAANSLGRNFGRRAPDDFYTTPAHATLALLSRERFGRTIRKKRMRTRTPRPRRQR